MECYELYFPPVSEKAKNKVAPNGRFMKGHVPFNKGKKWDEYLSKRSQKKIRKGWMNVIAHRPKTRPDNAGRCRKQTVAVTDDGRWLVFPHIRAAAEWIGGNRENVRRCCQSNQKKHVNKKTGQVNTDHKYLGYRFYYESDNTWTTKIVNA